MVREVSDRDGRFGSKVGQIGPKSDKSGAFSDQISVHLAHLVTIWPSLLVAACSRLLESGRLYQNHQLDAGLPQVFVD